MGLFDKVKNLFTEEVEEEPIRKETRHIDVPKPSVEVKEPSIEKEEKEEIKPTREDKFVYFTDDDFKDLEKPKKEEIKKEEIRKPESKPLAYKGAVINTQPEEKKEFKPSPIISPVYGILNKNYEKDDVKPKRIISTRPTATNVDDVRNKAFGTVEDDIKDDILGRALLKSTEEEVIEPDINIFEELDKYEEMEHNEETPVSRSTSDVDEIFGKLDIKKDEILDELDDKKDEILEEIDNKTNSIDFLKETEEDVDDTDLDNDVINSDDIKVEDLLEEDVKDTTSDVELSKSLLDDEIDEPLESTKEDIEDAKNLVDDEETLELARELEEQKKKLSEINDMMDENEKTTKTKGRKKKEVKEENLEESELFDLLDSDYAQKDDE